MLTVPKVIASGESVTIPAGRVAILPDVQVDGTLNVLGDIFIPTGTANSKVVQKVTSTDNAIVRFNGVTGDVQNSGVIIDDNNNVGIGVTPSGNYKLQTNGAIYTSLGSGGLSMSGDGSPDTSFLGYNYTNVSGTEIVPTINRSSWRLAFGNGAIDAITFGRRAANASVNSWTNAMTLDSSGNLLVGADSVSSPNYGVSIRNTSGTVGNIVIGHTSGTSSGNPYHSFMYAGSTIGSITQNGTTAVSYNTTSDYRLKENVRPADCKRFMDIKFVDYERIDGRHECGVIAHELQEIYPDLVIGEKDATEIRKVEISPAIEEVKDEDGNIITEAVEAVYEEQEFPVYQQVNYMGLIARIGTVVQQQAKLIETMRAEIDELKGIGGAK